MCHYTLNYGSLLTPCIRIPSHRCTEHGNSRRFLARHPCGAVGVGLQNIIEFFFLLYIVYKEREREIIYSYNSYQNQVTH